MSYADLARKLEISRSRVTQWRKGRHVPTLDQVDRIASALRIPPAMLIFDPTSGGKKGFFFDPNEVEVEIHRAPLTALVDVTNYETWVVAFWALKGIQKAEEEIAREEIGDDGLPKVVRLQDALDKIKRAIDESGLSPDAKGEVHGYVERFCSESDKRVEDLREARRAHDDATREIEGGAD